MINTVFLGKPGGLTQDSLEPLINLQAEIDPPSDTKNAVTLAHFFQVSAIQGIVIRVGDRNVPLRKAAESKATIIAFYEAKFMALNSTEKLNSAPVSEAPYIEIPKELGRSALAPMQRMLDLSHQKPPTRNAA